MNYSNVKGSIKKDVALSRMSWLKVGGAADLLFKPCDKIDLQNFLKETDKSLPVFVLGACSNLIIRDGGIDGICIKLGRGFKGIEVLDDGTISLGAALQSSHVAVEAARSGIDLTFLRTIPGTIGGAVSMNAGCYGTYVKDLFISGEFVSRDGVSIILNKNEMKFSYRKSNIPDGWVLTSANFQSNKKNSELLNLEMDKMIENRNRTQPRGVLSCGSAFRNPSGAASSGCFGESNDQKAWKMINDAGMRGFKIGSAQVSTKHSNFLINTGDATSAELEELGEKIIQSVFDRFGVKLEWEIKIVGNKLNQE
jgi:UDP-N-acetylmuramate dehydrogenase